MSNHRDIPTYLINLPTTVSGMSSVDDDGEPMVYLNARLTDVQHRRTYEHELRHLEHDDLNNSDNIDTIEARAKAMTVKKEAQR